MNYLQFVLFIFYFFSVLLTGISIYSYLDKHISSLMNRYVYLGETLLLGSIFLVGEMLILSFIGLYRGLYLWGLVFLNYTLLLRKKTIYKIFDLVKGKITFDFPSVTFIVLMFILFLRNCYFMVDIDSHSTYLYTQRLWLSSRTSILGNAGNDIRIFIPQFDAVPYGLGISIFGKEVLFPELINLLWRLIALLLIFGYTSYRFNKYYGLAASMLILFDSHFFYSGVNQWIIINAALIALLFATTYNFWESRMQNNTFRFFIAILFLSQLIANKYQIVYATFFILLFGVLIQHNPIERIKEVMHNKKWIIAIIVSIFFTSLWYFKNLLSTGDPVFPIFADKFHIFNWSSELTHTLIKLFGGISLTQFIKYMNYLFVWNGIYAAKYVIISIAFLPLILLIVSLKPKINKDSIAELCYWLGLSIFTIMCICLFCHQEPRYYRFAIGILSFSAIYSLNYIFSNFLNIKAKNLLIIIILLISLREYNIIFQEGGYFNRPTFKENINVIFNKIHMDNVISKYFPQVPIILSGLSENKEKAKTSAWELGTGVNFPAFLLPDKPMVSLWLTTLIKWDSYNKEDLIISDLKKYGIEWIARVENDKLVFIPVIDYARELINYDRSPKKVFYDYGFPQELSCIK